MEKIIFTPIFFLPYFFLSLSLSVSVSVSVCLSLSHTLSYSLFLSHHLLFTLSLTPSPIHSFSHSFPLGAGGVTKWESVDSGPSIIAPYGTRVGALASPCPSGTGTSVDPKDAAYLDLTGDHPSFSSASSSDMPALEDMEWRFKICPGTLIDAKDSQNVWYQVRTDVISVSVSTSFPSVKPLI